MEQVIKGVLSRCRDRGLGPRRHTTLQVLRYIVRRLHRRPR